MAGRAGLSVARAVNITYSNITSPQLQIEQTFVLCVFWGIYHINDKILAYISVFISVKGGSRILP